MNTYYTIYKITNQIDGKIYIGSHKTKNLNDNYMGSGKYLLHAQNKYGIENFTKEILFVFETPEEMYSKEAEIVNEDFLATENTYNLKIGGFGGFDYINKTIDLVERNIKINSKKNYAKMAEDGYFNKIGKIGQQRIQEMMVINGGAWWESPRFSGKNHSTEAKQQIGQKNSIHQTGSGNSQYGTMWITNEKENIKISKDGNIPSGWRKGRKIKVK